MRIAPDWRPVHCLEVVEQAALASTFWVEFRHNVQVVREAAGRNAAKVAQQAALRARYETAGGERVRDERRASVRRLQSTLGNALGARLARRRAAWQRPGG